MRTRTVTTEDIDSVECELYYTPIETHLSPLKATVGDKRVIAYLVYDADCRYDDLMGDCMGKLYSFHRHASRDDHRAGLEALGNNGDGEADIETIWEKHEDVAIDRYIEEVKRCYTLLEVSEKLDPEEPYDTWDQAEIDLRDDARGASYWDSVEFDDAMETVMGEMWEDPKYFPGDPYAQLLACYEHGSQHWSLSGQGMQCRWDTSNKAGVWVPDEYLRKEIESYPEAQRKDKAREFCKQFLETHNDIINGNVYVCVVEVFDEDGKQLSEDSCWGFVGDYAEQALQDEFFKPTCERLTKEIESVTEHQP